MPYAMCQTFFKTIKMQHNEHFVAFQCKLMKEFKMKRLKGFTLAEVLITLAIIGVVAAIAIPSVISNSQQQEFKTGLRKAVSVLNSAITMNMAIDGETPYDNAAFYTTDGMRFEIRTGTTQFNNTPLHENRAIKVCTKNMMGNRTDSSQACGGCGSYGLNNNADGTTKPPCLIVVDVNGDRKPSPNNINCKDSTCSQTNRYKFADPLGLKLSDIFSIMITDKQAIPYGVAAQRAMYQAQK